MVQGNVRGPLGSTRTITDYDGCCLYPQFVPQAGLDERFVRLTSTFDNQRLDAVLIEVIHQLSDRPVVRQYNALGIWPVPVTDSQLGMFANVGCMSH